MIPEKTHQPTDTGYTGNLERLKANMLYTAEAEDRALDTPEVRNTRAYDERRGLPQRRPT